MHGKRHYHFLRSIQAHKQSYESNPKEVVVLPNGILHLLLMSFAYKVENVRIVETFPNAIVYGSTLGKSNLHSIAFQTSFYNWVDMK